MSQAWTIVAAVMAAIAVASLVAVYYRRQNPKTKGPAPRAHGTGRAVAALRGFARGNGFRFIAPASFTRGGASAGLSAVAVGYFGVLGVVALGYSGEIYGSVNDKEWVQVGANGVRTAFPNPIAEASAAVRALRDVLMAAGQKRVPVEVVCVFTNAAAQLALPRSTGHYTMKDFKALLKKEKYLEDCGLDLDAVESALKNAVQGEA